MTSARNIPTKRTVASALLCLLLLADLAAGFSRPHLSASSFETTVGQYNVRTFGAVGDGKALDTAAVNKAIDAAGVDGGTVLFPAGTYLCVSIHLKSNVALYLGPGATILAADAKDVSQKYDAPEPNQWDMYQDFGHSHWQNSLIWGIGLENVSIFGPGTIDGRGLTRRSPRPRRPIQQGDRPTTLAGSGTSARPQSPLGEDDSPDVMTGLGNKAIALKLCRNVVIRDITIARAGHFALLATGVDNLTIDNIRVDTIRDGLDIDGCRNVRISNCSINTPNDDAIVFKSSYALGEIRNTENITVSNCQVTGYDPGTLLDGTYGKTQQSAPDRDGPTGRIKIGTESNGGFRNIVISNCVFEHSRGLAIESVDGGAIEDVAINNITMRDVTSAPIFVRLGKRLRAPAGAQIGSIRRIQISNVVVSNAESRFASIISGVPGADIEDISISNVQITYRGGGTKVQSGLAPPERETSYPEPSMFGDIPSYGFFIRHAHSTRMDNVSVSFAADDERPALNFDDVKDVSLAGLRAQQHPTTPTVVLKHVSGFRIRNSAPVKDNEIESAESREL